MKYSYRAPGILVLSAVFSLLLAGCDSKEPVENPAPPISQDVEIPNGADILGGTLTLPGGEGPHPAVILISGSGPQDRNGSMRNIPEYAPFSQIADDLSRQGIAVLRYDDRGVGQSSGNYQEAGEADFISDASAAVDYLLSRPEIHSKKIGLIGHSEGAMIAAQVSLQNQYVAYIVSLAGAATDGRSLLLKQTERITLSEGLSGDDVDQALVDQGHIFDLVEAQQWEELEAFITQITLKTLEKMPPEQAAVMGDPELLARQKAVQSVRVFQHPRYRYLLEHDNAEDWRQVRVPVLGIFGELDVQCDAPQNSAAMQAALEAGGNPDYQVVTVPGMNHLLIRAVTGSPREYTALPKTIIPGLFDIMNNWLTERL